METDYHRITPSVFRTLKTKSNPKADLTKKWYDKITTKLYEKFQIEIPLLFGVDLLSDIQDDMDLEMLIDELEDQRNYNEQCGFQIEYDLYDAIKGVRQSKYGYDEFDY